MTTINVAESISSKGTLLLSQHQIIDLLDIAHHLADIGQTSSAFWVFRGTLAIAEALLGFDFFHDGGGTIGFEVLLNVLF